MVVPIRDLGNMMADTHTFHSITLNIASNSDVNMVDDSFDKLFENISNNFDEVRGYSLALSAHRPRTPSMSSSNCNEDYVTRIQKKSNRMDEDNSITSLESVQLEYVTPRSQNGQVSKVANNTNVVYQQHVSNEDLALNQPAENNVVNIQLNYDINQTLEPKSWDGNFHVILLHSSMEHLVSNVKNIKDFLLRMCKYILGKSINDDKANNIKDLKGISKVA